MILLALALQAATAPRDPAPVVPPVPQRFSILTAECASPAPNGDIVVCKRGPDGQRLPLRDERDPAPGRGANPEVSGAQSLALQGTPCAARQGGCQVGVNILGPPVMLIRAITKLVNPANECCEGDGATNPMGLARDAVHGVKGMFARKPDKRGRVAIALDEPAPSGRIERADGSTIAVAKP